MPWKRGPLPANTWQWGGVVPVGEEKGMGFYFADFCGDHVKLPFKERILSAEQVAFYNNDLSLPIRVADVELENITQRIE